MISYQYEKRFRADPATTFSLFTDLRTADQRVSGIKKLEVLTDGPIRKGTRFRETRVMFNREATEEMEIADFQPGRSYTVVCDSCGARWTSRFEFHPDSAGTRVSLDLRCEAISFFAKLMSPLAGLFAKSVKKCIEQDMEDLRKAIESQRTGAH